MSVSAPKESAPEDDVPKDYAALTVGCGLVALDRWSQVRIDGDDRTSFLHNMCTNDIRGLASGESCEAFFTDVKGKIVAHLLVVARPDHLLLLAVPDQAEPIITHLDRYIIREDVTLVDETSEFVWLLLSGGETASVLQHLSVDVDVVGTNLCWPPGYLIRCADNQREQLTDLIVELGGIACDRESFDVLRIESGLPLYGVDFDSSHLPQEVDRNRQAINFNKGCYLGQETIARIDALGHVNKKVALLKFDGEQVPPVGTKLASGTEEVGTVTSSCWSPRAQGPLALAMMRRGANEVGSQLTSDFGAATVIKTCGGNGDGSSL